MRTGDDGRFNSPLVIDNTALESLRHLLDLSLPDRQAMINDPLVAKASLPRPNDAWAWVLCSSFIVAVRAGDHEREGCYPGWMRVPVCRLYGYWFEKAMTDRDMQRKENPAGSGIFWYDS